MFSPASSARSSTARKLSERFDIRKHREEFDARKIIHDVNISSTPVSDSGSTLLGVVEGNVNLGGRIHPSHCKFINSAFLHRSLPRNRNEQKNGSKSGCMSFSFSSGIPF